MGFVGTFHALCARILRIDGDQIELMNFVIYDESDQLMLISIKIIQLSPVSLNRISAAKGELIQSEDYKKFSWTTLEVVGRVQKYQLKLRKNKALDDIYFAHELLTHRPASCRSTSVDLHILVDEFQDTNTAQYQIKTTLENRNITVVGISRVSTHGEGRT